MRPVQSRSEAWRIVSLSRRQFLAGSASLAAAEAAAQTATASANGIVIDPTPRFDISPYLYMQFMEPLGVTDGSVEAAWDYDRDDWRKDMVEATRDLAPDVIRWGGLYSRYYKWHEGVGPVRSRPRMRNYVWGGTETNRVGTHEFVDFCRRAGAQPLYCVNFMGDGRRRYQQTREGNRSGDAREAADWVSYANDPDHRERQGHGVREPYNIKLWQLGNETSYGTDGFTKQEAAARTLEFARAMRERDPSIQLIGWGDVGEGGKHWAPDILAVAGEHLNFIAMHMMGQTPIRKPTVLSGVEYQQAPERAWEELMEMTGRTEKRLTAFEQVLDSCKSSVGIAITEGHLSLRPHNANPILTEWLTGVFHARSMNIYQRHGARVKIATLADFCGTRWTVNAVLMQVPRGVSYLLPAGAVMRLFRRHNGKQAVSVKSAPAALDIAASRTGNTFFVHVANTSFSHSTPAAFAVDGLPIRSGRLYQIAPDSPRQNISQDHPDVFRPREHALADFAWSFPPASVTAVELICS